MIEFIIEFKLNIFYKLKVLNYSLLKLTSVCYITHNI